MNIETKHPRGFTLIELLVVVAIIGLLSSVVLTNVNSARAKAKDAAIKAQAQQLVTLMELNFQEYGNYCNLQYGWNNASGQACSAVFSGTHAAKAREICANIYANAYDIWSPSGAYRMYSNTSTGCATAYSFMIALNNGKWYCVGSSGAKGEYASYDYMPGCYSNP